MKGTSEEGTELGMDGARERGEGGSERRIEENPFRIDENHIDECRLDECA